MPLNPLRFLAVFGIVICSAFNPAATKLLKPSCSNDVADLGAAVKRLVDNDNTANLEGLLAGYSDDAVLLPPQGSIITGKAVLRRHYERIFTTSRLSLSAIVAEAKADGNLGFVRGETKGTVIPVAGGASTTVSDKFLALVRCEAGEWRVTHLMWSPTASTK